MKTKPAARRPAKRLAKPATARPTRSTPRTTVPARSRAASSGSAPSTAAAPAAAAEPSSGGATVASSEPLANRDIGRLLRYGEHFGSEKIDVRALPLQLHASSGALAICDPAEPDTWRVLDRPLGNGAFRVMLSVARPDDGPAGAERLAAVVIHVGRPPIARWTVAQFRGHEPSPAGAPRTKVTSGWLAVLDARDGSPGTIAVPATGVAPIEVPLADGRRALALPCGNGAFAAYWAIDAADKPICIVIDFDAFTARAWKARPPA